MKVWSIVLSVLLLVGVASAQYGMGGEQSWVDADDYLHIPMTVAPPVIDGELDLEWYAVPVVKCIVMTSQDPDAPEGTDPDDYLDLSVSCRVSYDADNFYFFAEVIDDQPGEVDGADTYANDSFEIYFDGSNDKSETYVPEDDKQWRWVYDEPGEHLPDTESAWLDTDYGCNFELAIPAADLPFTLEPGFDIGFDVQYNDRDNGAREHLARWWHTSNNSWANTSYFGDAVGDAAQVSDLLPIRKTDAPFTIDGVEDAAWDAYPLFPTN
ncbi:hypothetical protein HQ585_04675, partial [candidate division KSB1 bacterium]|nr:hypothetical protein [candidate division KSB1 bacterium]